MVTIMGKAGAGNSTLMHIIGCIDDFEAGEYLLNKVYTKLENANRPKFEIKRLEL